jgi:hypothetical protein
LAQFLMGRREDARALAVIERLKREKRDHFPTDVLHVRALMRGGLYSRAERILAATDILPFEGASDGIRLQRHIKLMLALDMMGRGGASAGARTRAAIAKIDEARLWPRNLGVGKPYDDQIDARLEDWLSAVAARRGGLSAELDRYLARLANSEAGRVSSWYTLFQSAALSIGGREGEAKVLFDRWAAAQNDLAVKRRGEEFMETVRREEWASDGALELYRPVVRSITGDEDVRLF